MNRYKTLLIAILLVLGYSFLFLFNWGWILAIIFSILVLIIGFIPYGGTFQKSILNFFWHVITLRKREKEQENNLKDYGKKIAIALSGGVDSAVAALLLKEQGYELIAFFMKNWDRKKNMENNNFLIKDEICSIEEDYNDAKKIANELGIKLIKLDFTKEYWNYVFSKFLKDIENGLTPNPDILCNRYIKFDVFTNYVFNNFPEIKYVATGHYANIKEINNNWYLSVAEDKIKDQTYFLSEIKKEILSKLKFPLGNFRKEEVRDIAIKEKISVADKKESMGICFIGKRNFSEFISNYLEEEKGNIINQKTGQIIGEHKGVLFYTIGQRKGLNLGGKETPYYVSKKDIKNNILYVSNEKEKDVLYTSEINATYFNDLSDDIEKVVGDIIIKTRHGENSYKGKIISVKKENKNISLKVSSYEPIKFVTPGQELVLYQNEIVLGGGKII